MALSLVRRYRDIVRTALADYGGREVDRAGDGSLGFDDSTDLELVDWQ